MSNNSTKDLTSGSPMKLILGFSIPLLFGFLFQQFYSLVDTIIVGQFLGIDALAAVGSTGSINFMIIGFCMGVCNGFAIPIAHRFGARDIPGVHKVMANCLWLCLIFSLLVIFGQRKKMEEESDDDTKLFDPVIIAFIIMLICSSSLISKGG